MTALSGLDGRRDVHGLVAGRIVRLLADGGVLSPPEAARRFAAALSVGVQAAGKAHWAEGFLSGSGLLLAHDRDLLCILDDWVASLSEQEFLDVLPLLRRTFGEFAAPERSSIDRAIRHLVGGSGHSPGSAGPRGGHGDGAATRTRSTPTAQPAHCDRCHDPGGNLGKGSMTRRTRRPAPTRRLPRRPRCWAEP